METEPVADNVSRDDGLSYENLLLNSFFSPLADLPLGIIVIDKRTYVRVFNAMAGYFLGIQPSLVLEAVAKPRMRCNRVISRIK